MMTRLACLALFVASCATVQAVEGGADGGRADGGRSDGASADADAAPCVPRAARALDAAYHAVAGVDPAQLSLDLALPDAAPVAEAAGRPLVVYVHGGGWRAGDKRNGIVPKRLWAHGEGWAFATVNYRLSPEDATRREPGRVTWPVHADDVARAVDWLLERADDYCLDVRRVALVGFSAGANLAASVGNVPRHLELTGRTPGELACAVILDTGVVDDEFIAGLAAESLDVYLNAFTDDPATWAAMSPRDAVDAGRPRPSQLVLTRGRAFRQDVNASFVDALRAAGARAELVRVPELSHAEVNASLGDPDDARITPPVTAFLRDCFDAR